MSISEDVRATLAALASAGAVLLLTFWARRLSRVASRRMRIRRRFSAAVATEDSPRERRRPFSERVLRPLFATVGRPFLRIAPESFIPSARAQLAMAGDPLGLGPIEFVGLRLGAAVAGAGLGLASLTLLEDAPVLLVAAPLMGAVVGFVIPGLLLGGAIRGRKRAILRIFPSALDILAVSLEAGLGFDAAVAHIARTFSEPLAGEFRRLFVEFQMGRPRDEAMRDLARRTGVPEVARFVEAIAQAESLGVPYSRVIQGQAAEIRTKQRQHAEEVARTAPVKMIIPMVLLIFPAIFIVILGPAVPRLMEIFNTPR